MDLAPPVASEAELPSTRSYLGFDAVPAPPARTSALAPTTTPAAHDSPPCSLADAAPSLWNHLPPTPDHAQPPGRVLRGAQVLSHGRGDLVEELAGGLLPLAGPDAVGHHVHLLDTVEVLPRAKPDATRPEGLLLGSVDLLPRAKPDALHLEVRSLDAADNLPHALPDARHGLQRRGLVLALLPLGLGQPSPNRLHFSHSLAAPSPNRRVGLLLDLEAVSQEGSGFHLA